MTSCFCRVLTGLVFSFCFSMALADDRTVRYDWMTADQVSGSHVLVIAADGKRTTDFEFNDRGRGPKLHEVIETNADGFITHLEVTGHSYMGATASERFYSDADLVKWQSTLEEGSAQPGGFYWSNDGTSEQVAMLARALLKQAERSLPIYPAGKASLSKIAEHLIADVGTVVLYNISGLGLNPMYVWLDEEKELFAQTFGWMSLLRQGHAGALPELQKTQDEAESAWHQNLATRLTQKLPSKWRLRHVTLVDVNTGQLRPNQSIEVHDGKIARIFDDAVSSGPADEMHSIDGGGRFVAPGLWDMHTHLSLSDGLLHIAAGVTTTRDLANDPERLPFIREAFDKGTVIGPRSYAAGFVDKKSPYSAPTGHLAETLDEALSMIQDYAQAGYPQIKIYSSIEPQWVPAIAKAVHENGMRLSGHIPSYMTAEQAVMDGFDEIQHVNMLFLNFLAGPEDDTRTPVRFTLVAEKAGDLDLDSEAVMNFIQLLKDEEIVVDPTVSIFDSMFRHRSGELNPSFARIADHMPPTTRRNMLAGEMDINETNASRYERSAQALLNLVLKLHEAGIPLVAGTDDMAGFALHRELELYQMAGISAADVLKIATIGSAKVLGAEQQAGSLEVGKQADMILLNDNPLVDINAVRAPVMVFKGESRFEPARLHEAVGIRPFVGGH
jgi:hypothetical protein